MARSAPVHGDFGMLRAVSVAIEGIVGGPADDDLTLDEAAAELELVLAHGRVLERIEELKGSNPYAPKEKLEDGERVVRRASGLKAQIEEQKAAAKAYDERFRMLVGGA